MEKFNNLMEVFKLLEKTNCKKCNKPTCLAFAAAVFQGQALLSDCPFIDKKILETIILKFEGGPVGVGTIAASIGEEVNTIEDVYEPYLIQLGFVKRTPKGRMATSLAFEYLGVERDND